MSPKPVGAFAEVTSRGTTDYSMKRRALCSTTHLTSLALLLFRSLSC